MKRLNELIMRNYVMTSASWDLLATWAFRLAEVGPRLLAETVQKLPPDSFRGKRMPEHSTNDACTVGTWNNNSIASHLIYIKFRSRFQTV